MEIKTQKQYTQDFYNSLQIAYDTFNKELFDSSLPQCLVTLNRKTKTYGYFCPEVFTESDNSLTFIAEISLNPDCLNRPIKEVLSTLVHEMCHLWCNVRGYKARKGYHSKEWIDIMKQCGLQATTMNGEETFSGASKLTHKIIAEDIFDKVCDKLLQEVKFYLVNLPTKKEKKEREKKRFKYYCENCEDIEFTGKKDLEVICACCGGKFLMEE